MIKNTVVKLGCLLLLIISFGFAEDGPMIELVPRFLSVKFSNDECNLYYQTASFEIEQHHCIVKRDGQMQKIYNGLSEKVDLMQYSPVTNTLEVYYQIQPNDLIAWIDSEGDVIVNDRLMQTIEDSAKVCMPLSVCQSISLSTNEILISQADYGYLINSTFATVFLRKMPFSMTYTQNIDEEKDTNASFGVALTSQDVLKNQYNHNLSNAVQRAFSEGSSYAMAENEYEAEVIYGEDYLNINSDLWQQQSGFYFLYYDQDNFRVKKGRLMPSGFEFTWSITLLQEAGKESISSWNEVPISQLYMMVHNQFGQKNTIDLSHIKYIRVVFVE